MSEYLSISKKGEIPRWSVESFLISNPTIIDSLTLCLLWTLFPDILAIAVKFKSIQIEDVFTYDYNETS